MFMYPIPSVCSRYPTRPGCAVVVQKKSTPFPKVDVNEMERQSTIQLASE